MSENTGIFRVCGQKDCGTGLWTSLALGFREESSVTPKGRKAVKMADDDGKTSKFLMAWWLCFAPRKVAQQIKIGDDRSFTDALTFGAWCVVSTFVVAAAIAGKNATDAATFLWNGVGFLALAGDLLYLYPFLRPFAWNTLTLQLQFTSIVIVLCSAR